jgi:hypothetical protein
MRWDYVSKLRQQSDLLFIPRWSVSTESQGGNRDQQLTGCKTSGYESLLGYSAVQSHYSRPTFRRCVLPLSSTIPSNGSVIVDGKLENIGKCLWSVLMYYSSTCQNTMRKTRRHPRLGDAGVPWTQLDTCCRMSVTSRLPSFVTLRSPLLT